MKYLYLLFATYFFLALSSENTARGQSNILSKIDTNIVLYDNGTPLRFHQYIKLFKTGEYTILNSYDSESNKIKREIRKLSASMLKGVAMDQASIDKRIAHSFGIQEKLPLSHVDTTIVVFDTDGKPLAYHQYAMFVLSGKLMIANEKGKRYLKPKSTLFMASIFEKDSTLLKSVALMRPDDSVSLNNSLYWGLMKADRIRVEKSKRKMYVERNGKILYEFPINLGNHPVGHKQKEGDGRTPEGLYFIDYNINSKAAYKLGFHISYPNTQDTINAKKMGVKPGGDVMIHGTSPERSNRKDWTNGCIAVSNENLDIIQKYYYNSIPIQINK